MTADRVLLYIHIPKCGGTTLSNIIYDQLCAEEYYEDEQDPFNPRNYLFCSGVYYFPGNDAGAGFFKDRALTLPERVKRTLGRSDLRAVVGHCWFGVHEHLTRPWTYATLLRHPLDRVVSLYRHMKRHDGLPMTLEEYAAAPPWREVDNDQTRRLSGQEPALGGCTRAMLDRARDNFRRQFSVAGVTERFDETLLVMKRTFGWTKDLLYYPQNASPGDAMPPEIIAPATRAALLRWNELDLELYEFVNRFLDEKVAAMGDDFHDELRELRVRKRAMMDEVEMQARREAVEGAQS